MNIWVASCSFVLSGLKCYQTARVHLEENGDWLGEEVASDQVTLDKVLLLCSYQSSSGLEVNAANVNTL